MITPNTSHYYLATQSHQKLITGEITFQQFASRFLLADAAALICAAICGVLLTTRSDSWYAIALFGLFVALAFAGAALFMAFIYRRLDSGQFLKAEIVQCWRVTNRLSKRDFLRISYRFTTPEGKHINGTEDVKYGSTNREMPEAGTPLKVRYVDDRFFRIM